MNRVGDPRLMTFAAAVANMEAANAGSQFTAVRGGETLGVFSDAAQRSEEKR